MKRAPATYAGARSGGMLFIADLRRSWLNWIEREIRSALTVHGQHLVRDNPMDYDTFRALWHEALSASGLFPFLPWPSETIDLRNTDRTYRVFASPPNSDRARPFHVTATLSWRWHALHSARTATTEEDLLTELFGRVGYDLVTERPWLRVDVTLNATLPYDAPLPMPNAGAWQHWTEHVTRRLEPLLPAEMPYFEDEGEETILFWRGDPEARLQCRPGGQLYLTGGDVFDRYVQLDRRELDMPLSIFLQDLIELILWEDHAFTWKREGALYASLAPAEVPLVESILREQWQELGELELEHQAEKALTLLGSFYIQQGAFEQFVPMAEAMGARAWERITRMAERAEEHGRTDLALAVYEASLRPGMHERFLRKRYRELKSRLGSARGTP